MSKFKVGDKVHRKGYDHFTITAIFPEEYEIDSDGFKFKTNKEMVDNGEFLLYNPIWLEQKKK